MNILVSLVVKEVKDFWSNAYGIGTLILFILVAFLFLWVLPNSSYLEYGYATSEVYFNFISYLFLFAIPLISVASINKEYNYGTIEILLSRRVSYTTILTSKFIYVLLVVILVSILTSIHLWIVNAISINYGLDLSQSIGSYLGVILICLHLYFHFFCHSCLDTTTYISYCFKYF